MPKANPRINPSCFLSSRPSCLQLTVQDLARQCLRDVFPPFWLGPEHLLGSRCQLVSIQNPATLETGGPAAPLPTCPFYASSSPDGFFRALLINNLYKHVTAKPVYLTHLKHNRFDLFNSKASS